jgi:hypothetical protein
MTWVQGRVVVYRLFRPVWIPEQAWNDVQDLIRKNRTYVIPDVTEPVR